MSVSFSTTTFQIEPLTTAYQQQLIKKGLWKPSCPVKLERLRDVTVSYYNFKGKSHDNGHIIVLDAVAKPIVAIFKRLYAMKFPITSIKPTSHYDGDDNASMRTNNSSCFNHRTIAGERTLSIHAYGLAIDINPLQNPYIIFNSKNPGTARIFPAQGEEYMNRHHLRSGMTETIVDLFKRHGFSSWGGDWNSPIDYQHFQPSRFVAEVLAHMTAADAEKFFKITIKYPAVINKFQTDDFQLIASLYDEYCKRFNTVFQSQLPYASMHSINQFIKHLRFKLSH